jgi:hypothetical protein
MLAHGSPGELPNAGRWEVPVTKPGGSGLQRRLGRCARILNFYLSWHSMNASYSFLFYLSVFPKLSTVDIYFFFFRI